MLPPAERSAAADAQRFKQTVPIKKTAVEHRDHRALFGHELAVEENKHADWLGEYQRSGEQKSVLISMPSPKTRKPELSPAGE